MYEKECNREQNNIEISNSQPPAVTKPLFSTTVSLTWKLQRGLACSTVMNGYAARHPTTHLTSESACTWDAHAHTLIPWPSPTPVNLQVQEFLDGFLVHTGLKTTLFPIYQKKVYF